MTYDVIETSAYDGAPVELYEFTRGAQIWRYTSADFDVTTGGSVFSAVPISRPDVEQSQDPGKKPMTLKATRSLGFVEQYIAAPPTDVISLVITRFHTTDVADEIVVVWIGRVLNVKFVGNEVEVRCEPIFTSLKRPALRRLYQTTCPHVLYGPQCAFSKATLQLDTTVTITGGTTLTSGDFSSEVDGFYTGGVVEWSNNGATDKRLILTHAGSGVIINIPFEGMEDGASVNVFPGCDHTLDTCVAKFANELNYGGFPYIPDKNPFGGSPVF